MGLLRALAAAGVELEIDGLFIPNFLGGTMKGEAMRYCARLHATCRCSLPSPVCTWASCRLGLAAGE